MTSNRRLRLSYSFVTCLFAAVFIPAAAQSANQAGFCERVKPCQILRQSDAERILGQSARQTQDTSELRGEVRQCMCAYKGLSPDKATGQDCALYFSLEEKEANPSAEQARQVLVSTKDANSQDHYIRDLKGVGDEAFLLSNDSDSHLIMARKGGILMRLQVKRAAGTKSAEELKAFAESVFKHLQ